MLVEERHQRTAVVAAELLESDRSSRRASCPRTTWWPCIATAGSLAAEVRPGVGFRSVRRAHRGQLDRLAAARESTPRRKKERGTHQRVQGPQTRPRCKPLRPDRMRRLTTPSARDGARLRCMPCAVGWLVIGG